MKGLMGWALAGAVLILLLVAMQALIPGGVTAIWTWFFNKMQAALPVANHYTAAVAGHLIAG